MNQHHTQQAFLSGIKVSIPVLFGVLPFGTIFGVAAVESGLSWWEASLMSTIIYAGASQFAALQLLNENALMAVIVMTVAVINLRYLLYSASMATYFQIANPFLKPILGFLLSDYSYAVTVMRYKHHNSEGLWFYLGMSVAIWFAFIISTFVGGLLGAVIPSSWSLDFAIPLIFIAVLVPSLKAIGLWSAAIVSALVALMLRGLPFNLALAIAIVAGTVIGYIVSQRRW